ncbi:hypothetical protein DL764_010257 [Monosporascus ibericus]|uniref:Glucose-methanol-choline oxidoreductase N-terminal domain-containing protein n=1 Tax=Monosporascus ibericus TaxID=155417 RepID=A0A4Q4SUR9_9PEZI|nr:hypothetical protein DL764_010257 [Monosporascus ibericus]
MRLSLALNAIVALLNPKALAATACAPPQNSCDWVSQEWDAIVIGAGTAGIIVADGLSEAGKKTLLLELGGPSYWITGGRERPAWLNGTDLSRVDVPGLYLSIFAEASTLLCPPDVVAAFQGCAIGGNSAINAGLYFQPPASDWDDNRDPDGWKSADVRAAPERLLARQPSVTNYSQDDRFYLQSGYEAVRKWLVEDAGFADVEINDEPDEKDRVFGRPAYNYIGGQRGGPARTYLQTALARNNFHLQTGARVKYINQVGGAASGVVAEVGNTTHTASLASKGRIILSAGALLSPQILMYSGIGPEGVLQNLASASFTPYVSPSQWVVNPDVGEGLFDNPNTFVELSGPTIRSYTYSYADPPPRDRDLYLSSRSGPYAFASQTAVFFGYVPQGNGSRIGVQGTIGSSGFGDYTDNNTITLNVYGTSGLYSSSRVVLSGDNFTAGPGPGLYYADERDGMSIAAFIHDIFQALPASSPESPAADGLTPLNIARDSTVEEIYTYITTWSTYAVGAVNHWSSSCRIGKCVDADTKVLGTENIYVVDASVLPPLSVNPQFGAMVAAEKGAERILATWD